MKRCVTTAAVLGVIALCPAVSFAQTTTNLLINPGAEIGDLTGWTVGPDFDTRVDNGSFDSGIDPNTGTYDFVGGSELTGATSVGTLSQMVTLVGNQGITAVQIDSGTLLADVSFAEQGLDQGSPSDNANVVLSFFSGASTSLGTATTDVVDSHAGLWQTFTGSYAIPAGTRTILYTVNFNRNSGSDNDAFVDDNKLTISTGGTGAAAPEPGSASLAAFAILMPAALRTLRRRRRLA